MIPTWMLLVAAALSWVIFAENYDENSKWRSLTSTGYQCQSSCVKTYNKGYRCYDKSHTRQPCSPAENLTYTGDKCMRYYPCAYYREAKYVNETQCLTQGARKIIQCGLRDTKQDGPLLTGVDTYFCTAACDTKKNECNSTSKKGKSDCNKSCTGCSYNEYRPTAGTFTCKGVKSCNLEGSVFKPVDGQIIGPSQYFVNRSILNAETIKGCF